MSNESMANQITDVPSAIAELLALNEQLKKQLEDYKQENQLLIETNCELLNGELVKRLQQQLEVENKNNYEISAEMEHLRNQLKEAVEVIEMLPISADIYTEKIRTEFLAKYRGGGK